MDYAVTQQHHRSAASLHHHHTVTVSKAYHHLEHIGDTKEDRYQSVVKKEREKYEMDKIQGINPFSGKMKA